MHLDGQIYRPPTEMYTPLLQVTVGCSYNRCAFCTMYRNTSFRVVPEAEIVEDLKELASKGEDIQRLFLLNGDPFVLPTQDLLRIANLVHQHLPNVKTLTCYCSIRDLRNKSFEDLAALRKAGYNQLYIGLETGYEPALKYVTKGYELAEAHVALGDLIRAGFDYNALLMGGIAGKRHSRENAEATARLLNEFNPRVIALLPTSVSPGTPLEVARDAGEYVELTEREQVEEQIMLLQALDLPDSAFYFGSHFYCMIPVSDYMGNKERMVAQLREGMQEFTNDELDSVWRRGTI